jgi:phospholipid/cholesterol/gamma-HCH transport system substrate-binding protein
MKDSIESRLGMFFALAVIAGLVIMESLGTLSFFERGYHLHFLYKNVQDLKVGDAVKMGGVQVGRVDNIHLTSNALAEVTVDLDRKADVRTDSKGTIKFSGFLGQNYMDISFGTGSVKAENNATLETVQQADLSELMGKIDSVATGVENLTKSFSGEQIDKLLGPLTEFVKNNQTNLTATISNIRTVSDRIEQGQGTVGQLINTNELYVTALTTVSNLQGTAADIRGAAAQATKLVANANTVVDGIKSGQGTIGKMYTDDAVYVAMRGSMTNLNQILTKMNNGDGTIGKLINDDSTLNNVKLSLQKLDKATESLEDTGPLSVLGTMASSLF